MKKILCLFAILLFLMQPVFSASVIIENYTPEELKATLMKFYIKNGANIKNANDYQLVIDEKGNFWSNFLLGTNFNGYVTLRTTYNFIKDNNNTLTNINMGQIVNPNSAFENAVPIPDKKLIPIADGLKRLLNGYYGFGFNYKKKGKYLKVLNSSPSEYGLITGDKIYKINNKLIKDISKKDLPNQFKIYDDNTEYTFYFIRNKQEKEITLKSRFIPATIEKEHI